VGKQNIIHYWNRKIGYYSDVKFINSAQALQAELEGWGKRSEPGVSQKE